jgi:hypothetical protein
MRRLALSDDVSSDEEGKGVGVSGERGVELGLMLLGVFRLLQRRKRSMKRIINKHDTIAPIIPPQGIVECELEGLGEGLEPIILDQSNGTIQVSMRDGELENDTYDDVLLLIETDVADGNVENDGTSSSVWNSNLSSINSESPLEVEPRLVMMMVWNVSRNEADAKYTSS